VNSVSGPFSAPPSRVMDTDMLARAKRETEEQKSQALRIDGFIDGPSAEEERRLRQLYATFVEERSAKAL